MAITDSRSVWHPAFMPNTHTISSSSPSRPVADSRSSWHPAFMPHATIPTTQSGLNIISRIDATPKTPAATPTLSDEEEVSRNEEALAQIEANEDLLQETALKTDGHDDEEPTLLELKDALTTSLRSPGGVELQESPVHTQSPPHSAAPIVAHEEKVIAEFVSADPAYVQGHSSSDSFARTVPHAMTWGEDDEVDQEWNLHPGSADPFKFMGAMDRTNSFPVVPPRLVPEQSAEHELLHSQAEEIVAEVGQANDDFFNNDDTHEDDFFVNQTNSGLNEDRRLSFGPQDVVDFGQSYGADVADEEYSDRYEEGIPLFGDPEETVTRVEEESRPAVMFEYGTGEDDFFSGVQPSTGSEPGEKALARKSTMQVMDSLHFQPDDELLDDEVLDKGEKVIDPGADIPVAQSDKQLVDGKESTWPDNEPSHSSFEEPVGGIVAVSKSTIASEVFGESEYPSASGVIDHTDPTEEDLAARWKAALENDEFLDDDDELLDDAGEPASSALDPATLFGSDDEGFLEDDEDVDIAASFAQQTSPQPPAPVTGANGQITGFDSLTGTAQTGRPKSESRYLPPNIEDNQAPLQTKNSYTPTAPMFTNIAAQPEGTASAAYGVVKPPTGSFGVPTPNPPTVAKASSFANQAKGGYTSPYDLPLGVILPPLRKRPSQLAAPSNSRATPPPPPPTATPRGASMPTIASTASLAPVSQHPQAAPPTLKSKASFFEELPVTNRPKPSGRYTPQPIAVPATPSLQQMPPPSQPTPQFPPIPGQVLPGIQPQPNQYSPQPPLPHQGLVAPPPQIPYAPVGEVSPYAAPPRSTQTNHSAPPQTRATNSSPPPAAGRYAAAPPLRPQASFTNSVISPITSAHQPRTSSPLAQFERSSGSHGGNSLGAGASNQYRGDSFANDHSSRSSLSRTSEVGENQSSAQISQGQGLYQQANTVLSPPRHGSSVHPSSTRTVSNYTPVNTQQTQRFSPPLRSQTQPPGLAMPGNRVEMPVAEPYARPTSVHGQVQKEVVVTYAPGTTLLSPLADTRPASQAVNYVIPTDGRELDPLQRWKGAPVFAWGVGGTIVTSFPKELPRYGMSQAAPLIFCMPGEVKLRSLKEICPMEQRLSSFPGPLKGKSKKKDLITWLSTGIDLLEQENTQLQTIVSLAHEDRRREERVILWKTLRIMIENDGALEGNAAVTKAVRAVLSPRLDSDETEKAPQYRMGADLSVVQRSPDRPIQADPVNNSAINDVRRHLLRGDREKAVWEAVDKRLWGHAMLISNTVSKELYKQVAQEFVQKEVKGVGENSESLAALYEIFAGNFEESVDELVPPSARAGFQLINASGPNEPAKSASTGLDRWRETLCLIVSNRTPDDSQAILALGKLLSGYGRAEAAHVCFLFARTHAKFGGSDDPASNIVLIGSDHLRQPGDFDKELEPILLSEVYEYALSLSGLPSAAAPHMAVYRLRHATILAEAGQRDKALQYCEAIVTTITSQTRRSPYHHALLVASVDDLSKRLKQSPKDESSSWISKPSIDKVSGSVWAKFNKFVAGDETDAAATVGGEDTPDIGPFARIAGGTPTISRPSSSLDLHGSYAQPAQYAGSMPIPVVSKNSPRYTPGRGPMDSTQSTSYGSQGTYAPSSANRPMADTFGGGASYGAASVPSSQTVPQRQAPPSLSRSASSYNPVTPVTSIAESGNGGLQESPETYRNYRPDSHSPEISNDFNPYAPQTLGSQRSGHGSYMSAEFGANGVPSAGRGKQANYGAESFTRESSNDTSQQRGYARTQSSSYEPSEPGTYAPLDKSGTFIPQPDTYQPEEPRSFEPLSSDGYAPGQSAIPDSPQSRGYEPPQSSSFEQPQPNGFELPQASSFKALGSSGYEPLQPGESETRRSNGYESPQASNLETLTSSSYEPPTSSGYETPGSSGYEPPASSGYEPPTSSGYEPPRSSGYEPPASSAYEPPTSSGYEPPQSSSYEPTTMGEEPDSTSEARPRKSFMDDEEDDIPALKKPPEKTKAEKDKEAEDAFRRAAEEDAKKSQVAPSKKGWGLGGWFGGGAKKEAAPEVGQPNKPIRAKLGEESSFFYDPDLKRWVNKKGGKEEDAGPKSNPPPPRAGPPRSASGSVPPSSRPTPPPMTGSPSTPPSQATSRANTPGATLQSDGGAAGPGLLPPTMVRTVSNGSIGSVAGGQPGGGPPSRPATGLSTTSSIDDLLGPPGPRKGAKNKKKGNRYVDVMGQK